MEEVERSPVGSRSLVAGSPKTIMVSRTSCQAKLFAKKNCLAASVTSPARSIRSWNRARCMPWSSTSRALPTCRPDGEKSTSEPLLGVDNHDLGQALHVRIGRVRRLPNEIAGQTRVRHGQGKLSGWDHRGNPDGVEVVGLEGDDRSPAGLRSMPEPLEKERALIECASDRRSQLGAGGMGAIRAYDQGRLGIVVVDLAVGVRRRQPLQAAVITERVEVAG